MKLKINSSSTELLACSDVASKYFYGNKKSTIIFNGIETADFKNAGDVQSYSKLFDAENVEHLLVSVGRLSPQKNPDFAVEIISELKKIRSDFKYIWVGGGELETELRQKVKELGIENNVIFTGVRTDVKDILVCCDCFLMPSLFEGLPFSLVEAQAAGLPCIVSDTVTREADLGLTEYLSLESGAENWAKSISKTLDMTKKKVDEIKLARFDILNTVAQLEEIYDR